MLAKVKNNQQVGFLQAFEGLAAQRDYPGLHQLIAQNREIANSKEIVLTAGKYPMLRKLLRSEVGDFVVLITTYQLSNQLHTFAEHVAKIITENNIDLQQSANTVVEELMIAYQDFEHLYLNITNGSERLGRLLRSKIDQESAIALEKIKKVLATNLSSEIIVKKKPGGWFLAYLEKINSSLKGGGDKNELLVTKSQQLLRYVMRSSLWEVDRPPATKTETRDELVSRQTDKIKRLIKEPMAIAETDRPAPLKNQKKLPDFLTNLNRQVAQSMPIIGREQEISETLEVLAQRLKSNPILIGDAGVGKTAVVEGLAQRIVANDVPAIFRDKIIYAVDIGALLAGNMFVGLIEAKVMQMLEFIKGDSRNILFIDEFHRLMGSRYGQGVAELLKPVLSRGEICCIAATTVDEYQKYIQHDPAISRRFQAVTVDEPSLADALKIIYGLRETFADYHGITIADDALDSAVYLTKQFLPDKKLPDKAIEVIDRASSTLKIAGNDGQLSRQHIAKVIADRTEIPVERILQNKTEKIAGLLPRLQNKIIGQDQALLTISETLTASYLGLTEGNRPLGIFMLAGPTGVGKTETAKVLAESLFDSEKHFFRLDMSEYYDRHSLSKLIGISRGYRFSDEGGILTNKVRETPHSLILFDELEKAHASIHTLLLQVLEDGRLTDGRGETVDFSNTIIVFTTNARDLDKQFPSEFLGRIDNVIHYQPLDATSMRLIVEKQIDMLNDNLRGKDITLTINDSASEALIKHGFDKKFGARSLRPAFKRLISFPLAQKLSVGLTAGQYQLDFSTADGWQLRGEDGSVIDLGHPPRQRSPTDSHRRGYN